ncbi:Thioredoxin-like protein [Corchorus olitorius]|uniref:Thioredoxin-like protein n=1 Tax=Corchorus olitorius TaxID=93759 RepID=A0A1R3IFD7_9ROSI|nr:Thioredoxin-like protein [Corchorus olitorius]
MSKTRNILPLIIFLVLPITLIIFWLCSSLPHNSSLLEKLDCFDLQQVIEEILLPKPVGNEHVTMQPVINEKDHEVVVIKLTEQNFSSFIAENEFVMVKFYAPWSQSSQRLAPIYEAAAAAMKDDGVAFAQVDCVLEHELAEKYHIRGYPSLFLFAGGVRQYYDGKKERDDIVRWVRESIAGIPIITEKDDAEHLLATDFIKIVGFYDTLKGPNSKELLTASKLRPDLKFYQTTSPEIAEIFRIDPKIIYPVVVQLGTEYENFKQYVGSFSGLNLAKLLPSTGKPHYSKERAAVVSQYPRKKVAKTEGRNVKRGLHF